MRAEDIEDLQADVFEEHGEPVTIAGVVLRAVWRPAGDVSSGASEAQITTEADTFAFRRRDREARRRARRGAAIVRENGERYIVAGAGRLSGEVYRVIVTEEPGAGG